MPVIWPDRLPGYFFMPSCFSGQFRKFDASPTLVVLHSGSMSASVAEYLSTCNSTDSRKVAVHFAWSSRRSAFVQMVGLRKIAWHAGGSLYNGVPLVNAYSIGIELPGPYKKERSEEEHQTLFHLLGSLIETIPSLVNITRHSDIDKNKLDPGPGLDWARTQSFFNRTPRLPHV